MSVFVRKGDLLCEQMAETLPCSIFGMTNLPVAGNWLVGTVFAVYYAKRKELSAMAFIDYYKIMGIPKDTPQKDIRAAYTRRAKQFHPDLHPDDPKAKAKFQALNEAYDVLNDPEKRRKYDQYGENWKQAEAFGNAGGAAGGAYGGAGGFEGFDFSQFEQSGGGFSSFFEQLFGGGRRRGSSGGGFSGFTNSYGTRPDADARATVNIDMYTALLGGEIILQTQNSKLRLRVKPGTQQGAKVRLKGKGYDKGDGTFGDLIITYNVTLPTSLNDRQRDLLEQMRSAGN